VAIRFLANINEDFGLLSDEFAQTQAGGSVIACSYFVQEALWGRAGSPISSTFDWKPSCSSRTLAQSCARIARLADPH
jgi:hypothetical protein